MCQYSSPSITRRHETLPDQNYHFLSENGVFSEFTVSSSKIYLHDFDKFGQVSWGEVNCALPFALRTQKYFMSIKYMPSFNNKLLTKSGIPGFKWSKIKAGTQKLKDKATRH